MPAFVIHGDTSPFDGAETIETRDDLARFMFVTIEPGEAREVWIRAVPLSELAGFQGLLYQIDRDEESDAVALRQVRIEFWPFGTESDSLDEVR